MQCQESDDANYWLSDVIFVRFLYVFGFIMKEWNSTKFCWLKAVNGTEKNSQQIGMTTLFSHFKSILLLNKLCSLQIHTIINSESMCGKSKHCCFVNTPRWLRHMGYHWWQFLYWSIEFISSILLSPITCLPTIPWRRRKTKLRKLLY